MRELRWTKRARADLDEIVDYIAARNPTAAERIEQLIEDTADQLPHRPFIYRRGRIPDTREAVVHPNYIIVYRVSDKEILIGAVLHARQRYP